MQYQAGAFNFKKHRPYNRLDLALEILKWTWLPATFIVLSLFLGPVDAALWMVWIPLLAFISIGTLTEPGFWAQWGLVGALAMWVFFIVISLFMD